MAAGEAVKSAARTVVDEKITHRTSLNSDSDANTAVWEKKISQIQLQCQKMKKVNRMLFNRLYQVKRITKKTQWKNRFIALELDRHGDQYKDVSIYFPSAILGDGNMVVKSNPEKITTVPKKNVHKTVSTKPERTVPEKDPNAPKKPANAFFMYCQQKRNDILVENPALNHHDLTKLLAKGWNQSNTDEKQEYYRMYEQDKQRYEKQLKEYTERGQFTPIEKVNKEAPSTPIVTLVPLSNTSIDDKVVDEQLLPKTVSPPVRESLPGSEIGNPICYELPSDPNLPSSSLSNDDHQENEDSFSMEID